MEKIVIKPRIIPPKIELYIDKDLLSSTFLKEYISKGDGKVVIATNKSLEESLGRALSAFLKAPLLIIPNGESAKNKETKEMLEEELFKMGCDKKTTLIALGGGVVTDLVGFTASVFLRGVSLILIPTTLLAMVDAAIGGKTGINNSYGKNLIGSIYHPKAVFIDLTLLETLPQKQWLCGFAEVLKLGLIYDSSIFKIAKKDIHDPVLIKKAVKGKISVIEKDPFEKSLRKILNFGHTIAHGLEKVSNYELAHGLAVAIGCVIEAHLSMSLGFLSEEEFKEIEEFYNLFQVKIPSIYQREAFLKALSFDKKNRGGHFYFVLMDKIGKARKCKGFYSEIVPLEKLLPSLIFMEKKYG